MTGILAALAGGSSAAPLAPLVLTFSPADGVVQASSSSSQNMTTNTFSITSVTGGSGSYSYSWSVSNISGMTNCTPTQPSNSSTAFSCTGVQGPDTGFAQVSFTVTDTVTGQIAQSSDPGVNFYVYVFASFTG